MKKNSRYAGMLVVILIAGITVSAQQKLQLNIGYSVNSPVGSSFKHLINKPAFRGFNGEVTYPLNQKLKIGLGVLYNDFYQKYPRRVIDTKYGDISAVVTNSIQVTPVLAKVNYQFLNEGAIRPYAGLGAGFSFINYNQYLGEFPDSKSTFNPAFTADAGFIIPLNSAKGTGLTVGANFNLLPFNYEDVSNLNNWGIHAGFFFPLK